jgi:hypothetical protein
MVNNIVARRFVALAFGALAALTFASCASKHGATAKGGEDHTEVMVSPQFKVPAEVDDPQTPDGEYRIGVWKEGPHGEVELRVRVVDHVRADYILLLNGKPMPEVSEVPPGVAERLDRLSAAHARGTEPYAAMGFFDLDACSRAKVMETRCVETPSGKYCAVYAGTVRCGKFRWVS